MTKEKRSFFDKLTGSKKMPEHDDMTPMTVVSEDEEQSLPMNNSPYYNSPSVETPEESWSPESSNDAEGQLTIDVYQTDNDIVIKSTIAGVRPEDLDVAINNDMVTIKGERKNEEAVGAENYYYQECYWGPFSRSVVLPVDVMSDKVEAALKNGILTIRLPKAETNKTKRIQVRGF